MRGRIAQLAAEIGMVDARVAAMEVKGSKVCSYFIRDRHTLYTAQVLTQQLYPKVLNTLRELAGGGMIMLPSSVQDFADPEIAALVDKTQQSACASSRLGRGRLRIRVASSPVRDVLCGRDVRDQGACLPHL